MARASHSEADTYLLCERRHYYSYGLNLTKRYSSEALVRGLVGHEAFAALFNAVKSGVTDKAEIVALVQKTVWEEAAKYEMFIPPGKGDPKGPLIMNLLQLLMWYIDYQLPYILTWTIYAVERMYEIQVPGTDFVLPFVVDLIALVPGYGVVAMDHKFAYDFHNSDTADLIPQLPKYLAGLKILGAPVETVAYNELRYRNTAENKADPAKRFRFTTVEISPKRAVTTMKEQMATADRIVALKTLPLEEWESKILRSANTVNCQYCPFSDLCENDLNGRDTSEIIRVNYKTKEKRENVETIRTNIEPVGV